MIKALRPLVSSLHLPPKQEADFLDFLASASEMDLRILVELVADQPHQLKRMVDNYQAKKQAFERNDPAAWQRILLTERHVLESYS
jgi:hypothetical protein